MYGHGVALITALVLSGVLSAELTGGEIRRWGRRRDRAHAERRSTLGEPMPGALRHGPLASTIGLNSIELGLLAELSLEMARGEDAVANDTAQPLEIRRVAAELAAAWRERAQRLQLEALQRGAEPILPDEHSFRATAPAYTGPERRKRPRRTGARRTGPPVAPDGLARADRRIHPDRRRHDRRRPGLAPEQANS
jgi:hypothetical protein